MGFLKDQGRVLSFEESKKYQQYIKEHGIIQFLNLYKLRALEEKGPDDTFYWGDELEYQIANIDPVTKTLRVNMNTDYILRAPESDVFSVQPEFGRWMVEAIPKNPYRTICNPSPVLDNLKARRETITAMLKNGDILYSAPVFPLLGVGDYYIKADRLSPDSPVSSPHEDEEEKKHEHDEHDIQHQILLQQNHFSKSQFLHDEIINPHPRFAGLTKNIRERRGEKVCIKVPIYKDINTSVEPTNDEPYPGFIYMDAMGFGMGNCSLQVTFSTKNISDARYMTDQLAVFAPFFLALSAGSPIFKGKLADVDVRWNVIGDSVDDRSAEERNENHPQYLPKSRYSTVSYFISERAMNKPEYNDVKFRVNEDIMGFAQQKAKDMNLDVDAQLLKHLGYLFVRDPLVIFDNRIEVDDTKNTNHFENLQSTNWNSVRFKPPPSMDSSIGWRVELRPTEIQLRDEENAAFIIFALFIARYIEFFQPNFYMPMSMVDENFRRAHLRDAAITQKFWFRKNVPDSIKDEYCEITLEEFFKGKANCFTGMLTLLEKLCEKAVCPFGENNFNLEQMLKYENNPGMLEMLQKYKALNHEMLNSLYERSTGKYPTLAHWTRSFVTSHPKYNKDSIVSQEIASDLVSAMNLISQGKKTYTDFIRPVAIENPVELYSPEKPLVEKAQP